MQMQPSPPAWPTAWLMTDERMGEALGPALARAAGAGAGIVIRHYRSSPQVRRSIAAEVQRLSALLAIARDVALAEEMEAALVHNPQEPTALPFSLSVHNENEARAAARRMPALVFVSPVYPTRSHPHSAALGEEAATALARLAGRPAIALGGMDDARGKALMAGRWAGWAGIDCWLRT